MSQTKISRDITNEILTAVEQLRLGSGFGSIEIVLHESRITQIEKREKVRFAPSVTISSAPTNNTSIKHSF